jgi:hypothetical protein
MELDAINHQEGFLSSLEEGNRLLFWWLYRGWTVVDRPGCDYVQKPWKSLHMFVQTSKSG